MADMHGVVGPQVAALTHRQQMLRLCAERLTLTEMRCCEHNATACPYRRRVVALYATPWSWMGAMEAAVGRATRALTLTA